MGRSRGGLTTKIHALVDAEGRPVRLELTAGQAGDAPMAAKLLDTVAPGATVIADKAYDTDGIRAFVAAWGVGPRASCCDQGSDAVGAVGLFRDDSDAWPDGCEQLGRHGRITCLPGGELEAHGSALRIHQSMDLGRLAAS